MGPSSDARHTRAAGRTHYPTTNPTRGRRQATRFMKPQIEKPSEQAMKFFKPELFIRFNSADDDEADRADEEWEAAISAYREHLDGLRDQMPSQVKILAGLCLHDAELLACEQKIEPFFPISPFEPFPFWSGIAILSIRKGDEIISLIYALWDRVLEHPPEGEWPFSKLRTHWLYDEVDVSPNQRGCSSIESS